MLLNIVIGIVLLVLTVLLQAYGTLYLIKRFDHYHNNLTQHNFHGKSLRLLIFTTMFLIIIHLFQTALWAGSFMILPGIEFETLEESFYFSLVTFTSLGYGDLTIASERRILSGLEAINGIILLGWSTAFMFAVFREVIKSSLKKN